MYNRNRVCGVVAALALVAGACGDEPTVPLNTGDVSSKITTVASVLASEDMQELVTLSSLFSLGGASSSSAARIAAATAPLLAGGADLSPSGLAQRRQQARAVLEAVPHFGAAAAAAVLPPAVLGVTLVYDPATQQYVASARTGAPADGMRFILYAVDPLLDLPVEPLVETGYLDLRDLSTSTVDVLRLTAVSGSITFADYSVSGSSTLTTETIGVSGFVRGGQSEQVDVDFAASATATSLSLTSELGIAAESFGILTQLTAVEPSIGNGTTTLDIRAALHGATMRIAGTVTETGGVEGGTLNVTANGVPFAVITLNNNAEPTIEPASGGTLSEEDIQAIAGVLGLGFFSILFVLIVFITPVAFLFGGL